MSRVSKILLISFIAALTSCGGSGSGEDSTFVGGAILSLFATPTELDSGDRTRVEVSLNDIHENGVAVKLLYPKGLSYVAATAFLEVGEQEIDVDPLVEATNNANRYLVVVVVPDLLGNKDNATLTVELRADEATEGELSVDADVLPADIEPSNYAFDVESPEFTAEETVEIQVNS